MLIHAIFLGIEGVRTAILSCTVVWRQTLPANCEAALRNFALTVADVVGRWDFKTLIVLASIIVITEVTGVRFGLVEAAVLIFTKGIRRLVAFTPN